MYTFETRRFNCTLRLHWVHSRHDRENLMWETYLSHDNEVCARTSACSATSMILIELLFIFRWIFVVPSLPWVSSAGLSPLFRPHFVHYLLFTTPNSGRIRGGSEFQFLPVTSAYFLQDVKSRNYSFIFPSKTCLPEVLAKSWRDSLTLAQLSNRRFATQIRSLNYVQKLIIWLAGHDRGYVVSVPRRRHGHDPRG